MNAEISVPRPYLLPSLPSARACARAALAIAAMLLASGCRKEALLEPDRAGDGGARTTTAGAKAPAGATGPRIRFTPAAEGDVAELVKGARQSAEPGRPLLVYVGASWCEPCQRFHKAAAAGELDKDLPPMTLLEFDADKDVPRLKAAGYTSTYIPLFALPGPDGRSSGRIIQGGIKGENAASEIAPRLKGLIAGS